MWRYPDSARYLLGIDGAGGVPASTEPGSVGKTPPSMLRSFISVRWRSSSSTLVYRDSGKRWVGNSLPLSSSERGDEKRLPRYAATPNAPSASPRVAVFTLVLPSQTNFCGARPRHGPQCVVGTSSHIGSGDLLKRSVPALQMRGFDSLSG